MVNVTGNHQLVPGSSPSTGKINNAFFSAFFSAFREYVHVVRNTDWILYAVDDDG